jgi:hypothetical protein
MRLARGVAELRAHEIGAADLAKVRLDAAGASEIGVADLAKVNLRATQVDS